MTTATPRTTRTSTSAAASIQRAEAELIERRLEAPSLLANSTRNARADRERRKRWAPARESMWRFLEPRLAEGARVAILGAGNGDDLPLAQIASRATSVGLIDIDARAARGASRRLPRKLRRRVTVIEHDVTGGAADAIALAAIRGEAPERVVVPAAPLPGAPYDLAIGDLIYSQLLYPALLDLDVEGRRREAFLARYCPSLTASVVARLHASARLVLHVHDPLAWWPGHDQPVELGQILRLAEGNDIAVALGVAARGLGPVESEPRAALRTLGIGIEQTTLWHWPCAAGVDYLACATLARGA